MSALWFAFPAGAPPAGVLPDRLQAIGVSDPNVLTGVVILVEAVVATTRGCVWNRRPLMTSSNI